MRTHWKEAGGAGRTRRFDSDPAEGNLRLGGLPELRDRGRSLPARHHLDQEVRDSRDSHTAARTLSAVRESIPKAMPLIAGIDTRAETLPMSGSGLAAPGLGHPPAYR